MSDSQANQNAPPNTVELTGSLSDTGQWKQARAKFFRNKAACGGAVILIFFFLSAALAPLIVSKNPNAPNLMHALETPSWNYPLGTDELGRNILSRIIYGGRVSLSIAVGAVALGLLAGVPLGLISGYFSGKTDFIIQRFTDVLLAFPP
jgi:ABC-type dipeptide/oligopeptide/nickel transport system permease subunit